MRKTKHISGKCCEGSKSACGVHVRWLSGHICPSASRVWDFGRNQVLLQQQQLEEVTAVALHPSGFFMLLGFLDRLSLLYVTRCTPALQRRREKYGCACVLPANVHLLISMFAVLWSTMLWSPSQAFSSEFPADSYQIDQCMERPDTLLGCTW
jgi:hypothetical protein